MSTRQQEINFFRLWAAGLNEPDARVARNLMDRLDWRTPDEQQEFTGNVLLVVETNDCERVIVTGKAEGSCIWTDDPEVRGQITHWRPMPGLPL